MLTLNLPHDLGESVYHLYANKIQKRPIIKIDFIKKIIKIKKKFRKGAKKVYSTGYSQVVSLPSTNPARRCLTSVIEREPVHSA